MGEVYRARDVRLGRTVAIKVLHTPDADLVQRFEREARAVAALQHPNICTLIDVGDHDGVGYIVMEYLDGGPLMCPQPLAKVVEYGSQIANAVDAVHKRGFIHRDLKPENIIVTDHGVKILDFGIAKAVSQHDTITQPGKAIGTPAYMAPEQWRGSADHRTDIFALGCVLYEMASGRPPGPQKLEPARLEWVVRGCLAAEPDDRWQSARDVSRLLASVVDSNVPDAATLPARFAWLWPTVAAISLVLLASVLTMWGRRRPETAREILHLSLAPPRDTTFLVARNSEGGIAVAPNGRMLAFSALVNGRPQLFVRRLDASEAVAVAGTEGAHFPAWSPDSKWIAFYTPGLLMKVAADGGAPQTIMKTDPRTSGLAWGGGNVLLITNVDIGLQQVPADGGVPTAAMPGEWPSFLPDGKRFLFQRENAVWLASLDSTEPPRRLVEAPAAKPIYSAGHILFIRDRTLMAQPVDPSSLQPSDRAFPVAEGLARTDPYRNPGEYAASPDGLLVYAGGGRADKLVWRDRAGKALTELASGDEIVTPRISPDGKRVAFARIDHDNMDIWVTDLLRGSATRLTFDPVMDRYPIWSPDGGSITYSSGEFRQFDLYRKPSDGTGKAEKLTAEPSPQHAMDWSADGKNLSFTRNSTNTDLMILPDRGEPYFFLQTNVSEGHSQFSPMAPRWIAYSSDDSGRREIYVKAFVPGKPAGDARWQISNGGGTTPRWRGDARELYYCVPDGRIMAVAVNGTGAAFQSAAPVALFQVQPPLLRSNDINFDVTARRPALRLRRIRRARPGAAVDARDRLACRHPAIVTMMES